MSSFAVARVTSHLGIATFPPVVFDRISFKAESHSAFEFGRVLLGLIRSSLLALGRLRSLASRS